MLSADSQTKKREDKVIHVPRKEHGPIHSFIMQFDKLKIIITFATVHKRIFCMT